MNNQNNQRPTATADYYTEEPEENEYDNEYDYTYY